jgi:hypothetical protein
VDISRDKGSGIKGITRVMSESFVLTKGLDLGLKDAHRLVSINKYCSQRNFQKDS